MLEESSPTSEDLYSLQLVDRLGRVAEIFSHEVINTVSIEDGPYIAKDPQYKLFDEDFPNHLASKVEHLNSMMQSVRNLEPGSLPEAIVDGIKLYDECMDHAQVIAAILRNKTALHGDSPDIELKSYHLPFWYSCALTKEAQTLAEALVAGAPSSSEAQVGNVLAQAADLLVTGADALRSFGEESVDRELGSYWGISPEDPDIVELTEDLETTPALFSDVSLSQSYQVLLTTVEAAAGFRLGNGKGQQSDEVFLNQVKTSLEASREWGMRFYSQCSESSGSIAERRRMCAREYASGVFLSRQMSLLVGTLSRALPPESRTQLILNYRAYISVMYAYLDAAYRPLE